MTDESYRHAMRRRPLFSPVIVLAAAAVVALLIAGWLALGVYQQPGTVIVTRHAEKAAGSHDDPGLSQAGERRAQQLAGMFADTGVVAIFTSHYQRSIATAGPLANRLSLPVFVYDAGDSEAMLAKIDSDYRYDTVFVVGHSNTVPEIAQALSGSEVPEIDEGRYGDVFVIVRPRWGRASLVRYRIPGP